MHQISAFSLLEAARYIGALRQWVRDAPEESQNLALRDDNEDGTVGMLRESVEDLSDALRKIGATVTLQVCTEIVDDLDSEKFTYKKLEELLRDVEKTLHREVKEVSLYAVDSRYARYLESTDPPYGGVDLSKFGGASAEVDEAAKCLALRRNKAAVFHLMLAMEEAVRALAVSRSATTHTADGRWLAWLVIANNIDEQIIKPMVSGPDKVAWQNASSMLKSVGHAWRNPTDHPGASYSEEDADTIFNAVKGFMRALGPLI